MANSNRGQHSSSSRKHHHQRHHHQNQHNHHNRDYHSQTSSSANGHASSSPSSTMPQHQQSQQHRHAQSSRSHHSSSTAQNAKDQIQAIQSRNTSLTPEEASQLTLQRQLIPKLASRAYHLHPTNTWCQDWIQYQRNTHPVFGLCFHHPLHPIRGVQRAIMLVGSIAFGLTITNVVYLGFLGSDEAGKTVNLIYNATGHLAEIQYGYTQVEVRQTQVFLWTVGSFLHSSFDMWIWYLTACACCRPGGVFWCPGDAAASSTNAPNASNAEGSSSNGINSGRKRRASRRHRFCQKFGVSLSVLVVVCVVFLATTVVVWRLNDEEVDGNEAKVSDVISSVFGATGNGDGGGGGDDTGGGGGSQAGEFAAGYGNNAGDVHSKQSDASLGSDVTEGSGGTEGTEGTNSNITSTTTTGIEGLNDLENIVFNESTNKFAFLIGYAIELVFALFVFYPITSTVFFSGILGCCGKIPILGGRPYEIRCENRKNGKNNERAEEEEEEDVEAWST